MVEHSLTSKLGTQNRSYTGSTWRYLVFRESILVDFTTGIILKSN